MVIRDWSDLEDVTWDVAPKGKNRIGKMILCRERTLRRGSCGMCQWQPLDKIGLYITKADLERFGLHFRAGVALASLWEVGQMFHTMMRTGHETETS